MAETLEKLRPDRDLQCYFLRPSAVAALSDTSANGFTVSGCWRQQFDWAVIEWNRDNVFEHPWFRYLPDGDLSGLKLSYCEQRENCIPIDSMLYPTVDWPYLRVWAEQDGEERLYRVRLLDHATPIEGSYIAATAEFELSGSPTAGDYVGVAWQGEHHTYQVLEGDTLETIVQAIVDSIRAFSKVVVATRMGNVVRLVYSGGHEDPSRSGHNGNRFGAYAYVSGAKTEVWTCWWKRFEGGQSPSVWKIELDFSNLVDVEGQRIPTNAVRKMRWTYAADMGVGEHQRGEFRVMVTEWTVIGERRAYMVAGRGSRRLEDDSPAMEYTGTWTEEDGNYSGGTIHWSNQVSATVTFDFKADEEVTLFVGSRITPEGGRLAVSVDGTLRTVYDCRRVGEDALVRIPAGGVDAGRHHVALSHCGDEGSVVYFDYLELAKPSSSLPELPPNTVLSLATDWDTDHSLALAPERTAWMIESLGFRGRVNHYVGAMWFYELQRKGHSYASVEIEFVGDPVPNEIVELHIGRVGLPEGAESILTHLVHVGDTAETIARAFELQINGGFTAVRAEADGNLLRVISRSMGSDGNLVTVTASPATGGFRVMVASPTLSGGQDGVWCTDTATTPRLNRAVRDWSVSFFRALNEWGIDAVAAFSMELQHGDGSAEAGLAQRYPSGNAVWLNTPALQTNFSPASVEYWREAYREMAELMAQAGLRPYLQFGEVQWWYFPSDGSGMPFYDEYTQERFQEIYKRSMRLISDPHANPSDYQEEVSILRQLVGEFTEAVQAYVRAAVENCRFEVLYPTDVNESELSRAVNFPVEHWTPATLNSLKTESFTYTLARDLNQSRKSIAFGRDVGFWRSNKSHLVGIGGRKTAWRKEVQLAVQEGVESVVLFALDQMCLIGYPLPVRMQPARVFQAW